MDTYTKSRIVELEKEIKELEARMLEAYDSGGAYNNLKNKQHKKINELKKLRTRLNGSDHLQQVIRSKVRNNG